MPRLNRFGHHSDQRRDWFDESRTVFQDCSTGVCRIVLSDGTVLEQLGANDVIGGGGVWAAWLAGFGLFGSTLGHLPHAGIHGTQTKARPVSPDGAVAYKVRRESLGPWKVRERGGREWTLTDGDTESVVLLGGGEAVWVEDRRLRYNGTRPIVLPEHSVFGWSACIADGRVVVLYQNPQDEGSLVLDGRSIAPPSPFYFYPDVAFVDGVFHVVWSPNQADVDVQRLTLTPAELAACPAAVTRPSVPVPPPVPPTPVRPNPEPEPGVPIPAELHNQLALVTEVRNTLFPNMIGKPLNDPKKAFAITKNVAWRLRAHGVGLVKAKPGSANNVEGFTSDIVALANGVHWDVLVDGHDGASFPNWAMEENPANYPPIAARWVPAVPVPDPVPTPDPGTLEALIIAEVARAMAPLHAEIAALKTKIEQQQSWPESRATVRLAFKTAHGKYVSIQPDGRVVADRTHVGGWEILEGEPQ